MVEPTIPSVVSLTEEEIDDLLYFARAGELDDLKNAILESAEKATISPFEVLVSVIDSESKNGMLHMAAANGHTEPLQYLLSILPSPPPPEGHGVITLRNASGNTPLHWASLNGHLPVVKLLFEAGADPTILNNAGHDSVYEAEINGKDEVVKFLLTESEGLEKGAAGDTAEEVDAPNNGEHRLNNGVEVSGNDLRDLEVEQG